MHEWIDQYFTFYYVSLLLFSLAGLIALARLALARRHSKEKHPSIHFKRLNDRFEKDLEKLNTLVEEYAPVPKPALKLLKRAKKKELKTIEAQEKQKIDQTLEKVRTQLAEGLKSEEVWQRQSTKVYVLTFVGDIFAHAVEHLRDEVSLLLQVATPADEIVIRLTSPGGAVAQYGLASAQLARLRNAGLHVTACVDLVAASGGYMMAAIAEKIVASPFAMIGSIGVVAGIPNFHKLLRKHEVDYHLFTAGQYKRTVTPLAEVTEEGKRKFQEDLVAIHEAFKAHVQHYRPQLIIETVATGEYWLASQALEKGLVDLLMTSDDYLTDKMKECEVIELKTEETRPWIERLKLFGQESLHVWAAHWSGERAILREELPPPWR